MTASRYGVVAVAMLVVLYFLSHSGSGCDCPACPTVKCPPTSPCSSEASVPSTDTLAVTPTVQDPPVGTPPAVASADAPEDEAEVKGEWKSHGRQRMALGVLKPDAPYRSSKGCIPTDERWPLKDGTGQLLSSLKSPKARDECMKKIERLNPNAPLKQTDACAQNNRRWEKKKDFVGHMDYDETERRTKSVTFLANACPPAKNQRMVLIDAGCRAYESSTKWFRMNYPRGHDLDVYGMDVTAKYASGFLFDKKATFLHAAAWNQSGFVTFMSKRGLEADGYFHKTWMGMPNEPLSTKMLTAPTVPFGDFVKSRVKKEDFVILKIDIEGAEWLILEHMAKTGALALVDEIFLECHHGEWVPNWPTQHSLADCHRLFNTLRDYGIFAHEWY